MATTTERGYGHHHQTERARYQAALNQGVTYQCACTRPDCTTHTSQCPTVITADTPWDLGHTDDRTTWTGPECIPCNRAAGARNSNHPTPTITRWDW